MRNFIPAICASAWPRASAGSPQAGCTRRRPGAPRSSRSARGRHGNVRPSGRGHGGLPCHQCPRPPIRARAYERGAAGRARPGAGDRPSARPPLHRSLWYRHGVVAGIPAAPGRLRFLFGGGRKRDEPDSLFPQFQADRPHPQRESGGFSPSEAHQRRLDEQFKNLFPSTRRSPSPTAGAACSPSPPTICL